MQAIDRFKKEAEKLGIPGILVTGQELSDIGLIDYRNSNDYLKLLEYFREGNVSIFILSEEQYKELPDQILKESYICERI